MTQTDSRIQLKSGKKRTQKAGKKKQFNIKRNKTKSITFNQFQYCPHSKRPFESVNLHKCMSLSISLT